MARVIDIERQQVTIDTQQSLALELIAHVDYTCLPGSGRSVTIISRDDRRVVAAFSMANMLAQVNMVKEVVAMPPDRVSYRHVAGPYVGAVEDLYLHAHRDGTAVLLDAHFTLAEGSSAQLQKAAFEHEAQQHLLDIKAAAESRADPSQPAKAAKAPALPGEQAETEEPMLAQLPDVPDEKQLLQTVETQEEAEWGHVGHGRGVARVSTSLAESVMLPKRQIDLLVRAALLHDVGKIALSSSLWGTLGTLSAKDREFMYAHSDLGADLAARAGLPDSVQTCIRHHHERWDGTGYPAHLAGDAIPMRARILAIAESIDTMMRASYRRETLATDRILKALEQGAGTIWDPMLAREAHRIIRGK